MTAEPPLFWIAVVIFAVVVGFLALSLIDEAFDRLDLQPSCVVVGVLWCVLMVGLIWLVIR